MKTLDKFISEKRKRESIQKIEENLLQARPGREKKAPKGMVYSHSRLACFEQCPLKFKLKYIQKIKPGIENTVEAFMGSLVHDALEKLYKDMKFKKMNTLEELLEYYNSQWKREWNPNILVVRKEYSPENFRQMGEDYISTYYRRFKPFNHDLTIGLEERVKIRLDREGKYIMQGFIDRLAHDGKGNYEIHDYKTNMHMKPQEELEMDRQLALYAIAVRQMFPDASSIKQIWHFLAHDKHMTVEKSREDLEKLKNETISLIKDIENERRFPYKKSALCNWCEYRDYCPEFRHIARTENLPPNKFLDEPGVKLVNKYAELMEKKKRALKDIDDGIGQEIEQVREAIIKLAEKEGARAINGSSNVARIWMKDCYRFPRRNEPGREELEKLIRQSGFWEQASSLDSFALSRLVENPPPEWPAAIIDAVRNMGTRERIEKIYLSPKKQDA